MKTSCGMRVGKWIGLVVSVQLPRRAGDAGANPMGSGDPKTSGLVSCAFVRNGENFAGWLDKANTVFGSRAIVKLTKQPGGLGSSVRTNSARFE